MTGANQMDYQALFEGASKQMPQAAWLETVRRESLSRFLDKGMPGRKDEEWKYTRLNALSQAIFTLPAKPQASDLNTQAALTAFGGHQLVFCRWLFSSCIIVFW